MVAAYMPINPCAELVSEHVPLPTCSCQLFSFVYAQLSFVQLKAMTEEMKQMAALGLPVSFTASEQQGKM